MLGELCARHTELCVSYAMGYSGVMRDILLLNSVNQTTANLYYQELQTKQKMVLVW